MTTEPYVVIGLVPESPVDGTTFGTYLNDLSLQLVDANTGNPVTAITSTKVTLSGDPSSFVPPGMLVSFIGQPRGNVDLTTRLRPARGRCPHATRTRRSHHVTAKAAADETVAAIRDVGWTEGCDGIAVAFGSIAGYWRAGQRWRGEATHDGR